MASLSTSHKGSRASPCSTCSGLRPLAASEASTLIFKKACGLPAFLRSQRWTFLSDRVGSYPQVVHKPKA